MRKYPGNYALVGDSKGDMEAARLTERRICFAGVVERPAATAIAQVTIREQNLMAVLPYLS